MKHNRAVMLLAWILFLSILAGCGGGEKETLESSSSASPSSQSFFNSDTEVVKPVVEPIPLSFTQEDLTQGVLELREQTKEKNKYYIDTKFSYDEEGWVQYEGSDLYCNNRFVCAIEGGNAIYWLATNDGVFWTFSTNAQMMYYNETMAAPKALEGVVCGYNFEVNDEYLLYWTTTELFTYEFATETIREYPLEGVSYDGCYPGLTDWGFATVLYGDNGSGVKIKVVDFKEAERSNLYTIPQIFTYYDVYRTVYYDGVVYIHTQEDRIYRYDIQTKALQILQFPPTLLKIGILTPINTEQFLVSTWDAENIQLYVADTKTQRISGIDQWDYEWNQWLRHVGREIWANDINEGYTRTVIAIK